MGFMVLTKRLSKNVVGVIVARTAVPHTKTTKKDWTTGDLMGAIVVRLK